MLPRSGRSVLAQRAFSSTGPGPSPARWLSLSSTEGHDKETVPVRDLDDGEVETSCLLNPKNQLPLDKITCADKGAARALLILLPLLVVVLVVAASARLLLSFSGTSATNIFKAQAASKSATTSPVTALPGTTAAATVTPTKDKHKRPKAGQHSHCVGAVTVAGRGPLQVLQAGADASNGLAGGAVAVHNRSTVSPSKAGKAYLGEACSTVGRAYSNTQYAAISLVNSTFSYTIDLSATNCGCVVSLKFVGMHQNTAPGRCNSDFYCDALASCGSACSEMNIMQANRFMWKTSMRTPSDSDDRTCILKGKNYHPWSKCIDTNKPFRVSAIVSLDASSLLVRLTQSGHTCSLEAAASHAGMADALRMGMTPVLSYTRNIKALDRHICKGYLPQLCPASVTFGDMSLRMGYARDS